MCVLHVCVFACEGAVLCCLARNNPKAKGQRKARWLRLTALRSQGSHAQKAPRVARLGGALGYYTSALGHWVSHQSVYKPSQTAPLHIPLRPITYQRAPCSSQLFHNSQYSLAPFPCSARNIRSRNNNHHQHPPSCASYLRSSYDFMPHVSMVHMSLLCGAPLFGTGTHVCVKKKGKTSITRVCAFWSVFCHQDKGSVRQ